MYNILSPESEPLLGTSEKAQRPKLTREAGPLLWIVSLLRGGVLNVLTALVATLGIFLTLGISFVFLAAEGGVNILIGNTLLPLMNYHHYTDNVSALAIGAAGGPFASLVGALVMVLADLPFKPDKAYKRPWYISACSLFLLAILSGPAGHAILLFYRVDVGGIDGLHTAWAGALGGAITVLPSISISPYQVALISSISAKTVKSIKKLSNHR